MQMDRNPTLVSAVSSFVFKAESLSFCSPTQSAENISGVSQDDLWTKYKEGKRVCYFYDISYFIYFILSNSFPKSCNLEVRTLSGCLYYSKVICQKVITLVKIQEMSRIAQQKSGSATMHGTSGIWVRDQTHVKHPQYIIVVYINWPVVFCWQGGDCQNTGLHVETQIKVPQPDSSICRTGCKAAFW